MSLLRNTIVVSAILSTAGCVLSPFDLEEIQSTATRTFSGYSLVPSSTIHVRAFNQATQQWVIIGTAQSSSWADVPAGVWANNPDLYSWSVNAALSGPGDPNGYCFLEPSCTPRAGRFGVSTVRMMFEEVDTGSSSLIVFDENWSSCIGKRTARGQDFLSAAYDCRAPSYPELRLRFVEEWTAPPGNDPSGPPLGYSPNVSRLELVASNGATMRTSHSILPDQWSAWSAIPGGPSAGFAPVAPVRLRNALYALGNDGLIYRSAYENTTNTFGTFAALTGISCLAGRISVISFLYGARTIAACPIAGGNIQVTIYDQQGAIVAGRTFPGTEATLQGEGNIPDDEFSVAVRGPSGISIWWIIRVFESVQLVGNFDPPGLEDMSELLGTHFYGYELLLARANSFGYGDIELVSITPSPFSVSSQNVGSYALGTDTARVALSRDWIVWRDGSPGLRAMRYSPMERQMGELVSAAIGGTTMLTGRPAIFETYFQPSGPHAIGFTGASAVALGTDGRPRMINIEADVFRREVEKNFDVFSSNIVTGCASDPNVPDPIWTQDLAANHWPVVTYLGAWARGIPSALRSTVFREVAQHDCQQGARQPATGVRACELAKYPLVFSNAFPAYTCPDGIYYSGVDSIELGRVIARGLGMANDQVPPASWNAAATGVSLVELQAGASIFNEALKETCAEFRCPGFLGYHEWGEQDGPEQAFAYTLRNYVDHTWLFRQHVDEDLERTPCDDLLARKYDWIRRNIFHGLEFYPFEEELEFCP